MKVVNVVYQGELGRKVDLNKLIFRDDIDVEYSPETMNTAIIRPYHPAIKTIMIHASGKFFVFARKVLPKDYLLKFILKIINKKQEVIQQS